MKIPVVLAVIFCACVVYADEQKCPCQNGGKCYGKKNVRCKCLSQTFGDRCEFKCPCKNSGKCEYVRPVESTCTTNEDGSKSCTSLDVKCTCKPFFTGQLCDACSCQNGGVCTGKKCKCPAGYIGSSCEKKCPCQNGGECIGDTTQCKCNPKFSGPFCQFSSCLCRNGGTCRHDKTCKCMPGFIGERCQMKCPCKNGGRCVGKTTATTKCQCPAQTYGAMCEWRCPCRNGGRCTKATLKKDVKCVPIGLHFEKCQYDFTCDCTRDWKGDRCTLNACDCVNGGRCVKGRCVCRRGWTGKRCEQKMKCCNAWGDPHLMSFDGARLDFQGDCRYNMMSICPCVKRPADVPALSVHMKNWRSGGTSRRDDVSWVKSVDVYIDGTKITFGQKRQVRINDVNATLPIKKIKNSLISTDGKTVRVDMDFGASVSFDGIARATVCAPESLMGKLCGVCGNYDGDRDNDYVTRDGDKLEHVKTFRERAPYVAASWRVMNARGESCSAEPLYKPEPQSESFHSLARSREFCGLIGEQKGEFGQCIAKMSPSKVSEYLKACYYDVVEMLPNKADAKEMACESLEAFLGECAELDAEVDKNWRKVTGCKYTCPSGMEYKEKMSACINTCSDPNASKECSLNQTEGCACPEGTLLSGGICVKASQCGCTDEQGNYYQVRETFFSEDCSEKYVCQPGTAEDKSYLDKQPGCTADQVCTAVNGVQRCVMAPVNGDWGDWSEWSQCERMDGHETIVQKRTRACDSPAPKYGGTCVGDAVEYQECLPTDFVSVQPGFDL